METGIQQHATGPAALRTPALAVLLRVSLGKVWLFPFLATMAILLVGIDGPSFWRDEAVTISVARRPLPDIFRLLGHVDAVHGLYYLLMHPLVAMLGIDEWALRLPSAIAGATAAGGIAAITTRLGVPAAAVPAGLLYGLAPPVSQHGQEARSYALVGALAVLATYLFVRALQGRDRRWYIGYAAALTVLGLLHLIAFALVVAHGTALLLLRRTAAAAVSPWRWVSATAAACLAVAPLAMVAATQRDAISWMTRPGPPQLAEAAFVLTGTGLLAAPIGYLAITALRARGSRERPPTLTAITVPWLLLPPLLVLIASQVHPLYDIRYLLFCLPAAAILAGAGLARLPARLRIAAVALIALAAVPQLVGLRQESSRMDDLRAAARVVREHAAARDAVLYLPGFSRSMTAAYPDAFGRLDDVGMAASPTASATIDATSAPPAVTTVRLSAASRIWLLSGVSRRAPGSGGGTDVPSGQAAILREAGPFSLMARWQQGRLVLSLYSRTSG